ncbi:MAG: DUF2652 domain-containing protein [Bacteroidota bacterium]
MDSTDALICIPDITGFTQFMSESDLSNSRKIIPSLLNKIIYSNDIGLKVSEIEGDAVLFFRSGELPSLQDLIGQSQKFYTEFNHKLKDFMFQYSNEGDFDALNERLGLKIIWHYGPITMERVGTHLKLIGEDVIVAHRLLKNKVELDEYVLLTKELMDKYPNEEKEPLNQFFTFSTENYDHIGRLPYYFIDALNLNKVSV